MWWIFVVRKARNTTRQERITALSRVISEGLVVISGQPISPLKMGPICCPESSVRNYHYSLRNSPKERSPHLLRGGTCNHSHARQLLMTQHWRAFVQPLLSRKRNMYDIFWVRVCSLRYPACIAYASYYIFVRGLSGCTIFFHNISWKVHLSETIFEHRMCVLILPTTFFWNISHYKKKWVIYYGKCT